MQLVDTVTVAIKQTTKTSALVSDKLSYVDEMRGIAILMVIVVHVSQSIHGLSIVATKLSAFGQMGVQLFFVASAYTLCLSMDRRSDEPQQFGAFYVRRYFRIAPLYYLAILFYFGLFMAKQYYLKADPSLGFGSYTLTNILCNVFFIHGFVPSAINSIVPGGWSIGTEMAFYSIFPFLFLLMKKMNQFGVIILSSLLIFSICLNFAAQAGIASLTGTPINNLSFSYFNIVNQLPVFVIGGIAYFISTETERNRRFSNPITAFAGFTISLTVALVVWWSDVSSFLMFIPTICATAFFFLLYLLKNARKSSRLICKIGQLSYSMYIVHFTFALVVKVIFKRFADRIEPHLLLVAQFLLVTTLTFAAALLTEASIEKKGIKLGSNLVKYLQRRNTDTYNT